MTTLHAIVQRLLPAPVGFEIVFLADERAEIWSRLRDEAWPYDYDTAQRYARACGGTALVLPADEYERLMRERQPTLPGLSRFLDAA